MNAAEYTPRNLEEHTPEEHMPENIEEDTLGNTEEHTLGGAEEHAPGNTEEHTSGNTEEHALSNTEEHTPGNPEKHTPGGHTAGNTLTSGCTQKQINQDQVPTDKNKKITSKIEKPRKTRKRLKEPEIMPAEKRPTRANLGYIGE